MIQLRVLAVMIMGALVASGHSAEAAENAPALAGYKADLGGTSVSGLSSGGFMAFQYHVAESASTIGAGIVAGGPFFCGHGNVTDALFCMGGALDRIDPKNLLLMAKKLEAAGEIDPLDNLKKSKVYLFSGALDSTVHTATVSAATEFYKLAGVPKINYVTGVAAGHAFIALDAKNYCSNTADPYVNKCEVKGAPYDQPGEILKTIYGDLAAPAAVNGKAVPFDQTRFGFPEYDGLAKTGYVYVPPACVGGAAACRVHVVFHGCKQSADIPGVGDVVYNRLGYNRWAETNKLIVLYPQTAANYLDGKTPPEDKNPKGCWDWWGFTTPSYATKNGLQIAAVAAMVKQLGSGH